MATDLSEPMACWQARSKLVARDVEVELGGPRVDELLPEIMQDDFFFATKHLQM